MATISKRDAEAVASFLSYVVGGNVPFRASPLLPPDTGLRLAMEELGIVGHSNPKGGYSHSYPVEPMSRAFLPASRFGILLENSTPNRIDVIVPGQPLTTAALELIPIANLAPADYEFLREVANKTFSDLRQRYTADVSAGRISVFVVARVPIEGGERRDKVYTAGFPPS